MSFITAGAYFFMYFTTAPSVIFWFLTFVSSMNFHAYVGIHLGVVGDAMDFGEFISGTRCDGFLSSSVFVISKAGGAVMPAIGAAVLAAMYYMAGGAQSTQILNAINWFITLISTILNLINAVLYLMHPISTGKRKEIMGKLTRRRQ